jgi:hypothetical protein
MHSESITGVISEAKRASESPVAQFLARAGLTARGVIYIQIGWVAVLVALGHSSQEADQRGALELLAGKPYGLVSLWLVGVGFAAYALWRLSKAAFGVTAEPPSAAVTHKASQSGGIDKALLTLRNQPLGEFLVMLAAVGLAVFYGLCEARWRNV